MNEAADLYQKLVLEHNKSPFHFEKKETANHQIEAYNPLCGDQYQLYLDLDNGVITDLHFHGYGCAISKAACSVLAKLSQKTTLKEFNKLYEQLKNVVDPGKGLDNHDIPEELKIFQAARKFPARIQCVTLGWDSLIEYVSREGAR